MESLDPNNLRVKLTDFGFSCFFQPGEGQTQVLGSPLYMAPEIIESRNPYDQKVDLWSLGVIIYQIFTGKTPFRPDGDRSTLDKIIICDYDMSSQEKIPLDA